MGSIPPTRTHRASILIGRVIVFVSAFGLWSSTAAAQAPPAEMDALSIVGRPRSRAPASASRHPLPSLSGALRAEGPDLPPHIKILS